MNEFEWRLQMRELRQPLVPQRDLWAGIESALDEVGHQDCIPSHRPRTRRAHWVVGVGLAASLLLAVGIGWEVTRTTSTSATRHIASNTPRWQPTDPRLGGAAIELDAARMELLLAIQQSPDSPALQRLLGRTEQQQTQLRKLASQPG